eukprot:m.17871 g.17871  ORF g.17871 m.17871 type:complete len:65 (+) comp3542_c0_seq1:1542-1736(+)
MASPETVVLSTMPMNACFVVADPAPVHQRVAQPTCGEAEGLEAVAIMAVASPNGIDSMAWCVCV